MNMPTYNGNMVGADFSTQRKRPLEASGTQVKTGSTNPYAKYAQTPVKNPTREIRVEAASAKPVPEPPKKENGVTPLRMFLAFMALTALMIVWVWESAKVRQDMIELERLKDQRTEIEKTNDGIQAEISKLSGYDRIGKIAKEQLKMIPAAEKPGVIFIDADKAAKLDKQNSPKQNNE